MELDVPANWKRVRLTELGEVNRGRSRHRPRHALHLYGGPYPFVQTGDIKASGGRITSHTQTYSEAGLAQSRLWPTGTMCITIAANIAETAILTYPACFPDSVIGFLADPTQCDVRFIEFMFRRLRRLIQHMSADSGTVQDNINLEFLDTLYFPLPSLDEQKAIARVLGVLDDKIELNRRMNHTLEALARALFNHWFDSISDNLPHPTVAELTQTGALVVNDGYRAKRSELGVQGLPFVRAGNLYDDGVRLFDAEILSTESVARAGEKVSRPGDVAFTSKGTVGRLTFISRHVPRFVYSPQVCFWRVTDTSALDPHVLYRWMRSDEFTGQVDSVKGQTDMADYVSLTDQRRMRITLPPIELQRHVAPKLAIIDEAIAAKAAQIGTLARLRDVLLPQLLSGALRVRQAEKLVEAKL